MGPWGSRSTPAPPTVVTVERDLLGKAWAVAPCSCRMPLLDALDPVRREAFMAHVLERTPCAGYVATRP